MSNNRNVSRGDTGRNGRYGSSMGKTACIDAGRVFDSCSDRDCAEDLRVYFSEHDQCRIDQSSCVRAKKATVLGVNMDVEPMTFRDGCYACTLTYFIKLTFEIDGEDLCKESVVGGVTAFEKKVTLYGGEGSVQVFSTDYTEGGCHTHRELSGTNMPRLNVQIAEPVVLDTRVVEACGCRCKCCCSPDALPDGIVSRMGYRPVEVSSGKTVLVTLGVFSIVQMIRNVQMLMPVYDYCVPCKECNCHEETPCEVFHKMNFPLEEFFPTACEDHKSK